MFLVFKTQDGEEINYLFLLFSNFEANFTIHEIISTCEGNPMEITVQVTEEEAKEEIYIYSNPSLNGIINFSTKIGEVWIYSIDGSLVHYVKNAKDNINLNHLNKGIYFAKTKDNNLIKFVLY